MHPNAHRDSKGDIFAISHIVKALGEMTMTEASP
jgi:hypothetical protein